MNWAAKCIPKNWTALFWPDIDTFVALKVMQPVELAEATHYK